MLAASGSLQSYAFHPALTPSDSTTFTPMSAGYKPLYGDREDLDREEVRNKTFIFWPKWTPQSLTKESMAKAGLYFTGDEDKVRCFQCKVVLGNWKDGDVPLERHRHQSPRCSFVENLGTTDEDDLVVDGEQHHEGFEEVEEEDFVDGATEQVHSRGETLLNRCEDLVTLPAVNKSLQIKTSSPHKFDKNQLKHENESLRKAMICRKCKTERIQTLFLPCRHLVTCEECADKMDDCIQCNQRILGTVRTFMI